MRVIFFGTPQFAAEHLKTLIDAGIDVVAVVTKPDKPQGRSQKIEAPAVKKMREAIAPHIPLFQPEKCSSPEFVETLRKFQPDLFVVVAFGEIIKQSLLDLPSLGAINVHASLLPAYRGAAPIQRALLNGEKETGITIIKLVLKMDAGDMLHREKVSIPEEMTFPELENQLCKVGCKALLKVIADFEKGSIKAEPQDATQVTFAPKIETQECCIDWKKSAGEIHNLVRAVTPSPGAFFYILHRGERKRLKILKSRPFPGTTEKSMTVFAPSKETLAIQCVQGVLLLEELQLEGAKAMSVSQFMRGIQTFSIVE